MKQVRYMKTNNEGSSGGTVVADILNLDCAIQAIPLRHIASFVDRWEAVDGHISTGACENRSRRSQRKLPLPLLPIPWPS